MAITRDQVEYVAHLSRLRLTDEQKARFAEQLDSILQYVDKLNELDTAQIEPLVHIAERINVFREDTATPSLPHGEAVANAPDRGDGCFRVPRIID